MKVPSATLSEVPIVLGIDQAAKSGWAIWLAGRIHASGSAETNSQRMDAVELAENLAYETLHRPSESKPGIGPAMLVVFEDHSSMRIGGIHKGGKIVHNTSVAVILGIGRAHGWWECLLDQAGHDDRARIKVLPRVWRRNVLSSHDTKAANDLAMLRYGVSDPDEAVACALAEYGAKSPEGKAAWLRAFGPKARARKARVG